MNFGLLLLIIAIILFVIELYRFIRYYKIENWKDWLKLIGYWISLFILTVLISLGIWLLRVMLICYPLNEILSIKL